ncbi:acylneuraminate cytidylyltransferase family protein, partial [Pelagibacteraceae bacterium]|nr:acylneuraminate cytidylyltransferase family protein [Pelagibacteraceae bacterium]
KNVKLIAGIPLIAHTITQAIKSNCFDKVVVSSDDAEILEVSKKYGAYPLNRPADLATDAAGTIPALNHAFIQAESLFSNSYSVVCLLQPTSPLRTSEDISSCIKQLEDSKLGNIFSVCHTKASPYYTLIEKDKNSGVIQLSKSSDATRRQDLPDVYEINGAIYAWKKEQFLKDSKTIQPNSEIYIMPHERSLDIDTPFDFELCRLVLENQSS